MISSSGVSADIDRQTQFTQTFPADSRLWMGGVRLALLVCISTSYAAAQAAAEYGQVSAAISAAATKASTGDKNFPVFPIQSRSPSIAAQQAEAGGGSHRKDLEAQAGKNAAKLMLRSIPSKAWVRINARLVGVTPLLLIVPPGVYVIEMERGARMESGRRQVDLLPKETREVVLTLKSRYPTHIRMSSRSPE